MIIMRPAEHDARGRTAGQMIDHAASSGPRDGSVDGARAPLTGDTVGQFMSSPVLTVDAEVTLREALAQMEEHGLHHLLVEHGGRLVGVVSDRDLLRHLSPFVGTLSERERDQNTLLRRVFQFATYRPVTVQQDAPIFEAAAELLERQISSLLVLDGEGRPVGVLTTRDLLRGMLECRVEPPVEPAR